MANNYKHSKNNGTKGKISEERETSEFKKEYDDRPRRGGKGRDYDNKRSKAHNSPDWYSATPQLLIDSASLAYSWPTGTKVDMQVPVMTGYYRDLNKMAIPGVMALKVMMGPGVSTNNTDPVNMAARNIYSFVRHANAGHSNYDAPDLMLYLLAMDNVFSFYAFMVRLYGTIQLYTQTNRYYPRALIQAMGCDYDDLIEKLADLRYFINSYGYKLGMFAVPASMSYFVRHQWLFSNLYVDSTSSKAQTYMFVPHGFHGYNETDGAGYLKYEPFDSGEDDGFTLNSLIRYGNAMLDKIAASEDMNIMSGDILKAYGTSAIFKVGTIDDAYYVLPVYDPEVISQIQNATIYPEVTQWSVNPALEADTRFDITQDTNGALSYEPYFFLHAGDITPELMEENGIWMSNRLISMYKDDVQPGDNMVATRFTSAATVTSKTIGQYEYVVVTPKHIGSEVIVGGFIYGYIEDSTGDWTLDVHRLIAYQAPPISDPLDLAFTVKSATLMESFGNHAMTWLPFKWSLTGAAPFTYTVMRLFDINNYTLLSDSDLTKMHQTALLSEFNSPQVAKAQPSNYK